MSKKELFISSADIAKWASTRCCDKPNTLYQKYCAWAKFCLLSKAIDNRIKFSESLKEDKSGAEYALKQIGMLYKVEAMADDQDMDAGQRAELRQRLAYPILVAFEKWIVSYYPKAIKGGRMYKAFPYTYNLFHRLSRYHLDGRYRIDNNQKLDLHKIKIGHHDLPQASYKRSDLLLCLMLFPIIQLKSVRSYLDSCSLNGFFEASKNTFYCMKNDHQIDWRHILNLVNRRLFKQIKLHGDCSEPDSPRCLIVDDTDFKKTSH